MPVPHNTRQTRTLVFALLASLAPVPLIAGGPVHGAKSAGMGTAFVAVADDPSAILHNPAGLATLEGDYLYGGVTALFPSTEYESPTGLSEQTDFQAFFPPHLFLSTRPGQGRIVYGLGIYAPFGVGGRKWPDDGVVRYVSQESFIATLSLNPTVAWQPLPGVSLAVGVDYMRAFNRMRNRVDQSLLGAGDAVLELEADGGGWGYNLGVLFRLGDSFRLGLAYRSEIEVDMKGNMEIDGVAPALQPLFGASRFRTGVRTTSTFPQIYSVGLAWFPNPRLTLALDHEWVDWSSFDRAAVDLDEEVPAAGVTDTTSALDWKLSRQLKFGLDYRLDERFSLRAGYAFINHPVPEGTLSPANPDADQHNVSVGLGYRRDNWDIDLFYDFALYDDRKVDNAILAGRYDNQVHYLGVSIGYRR